MWRGNTRDGACILGQPRLPSQDSGVPSPNFYGSPVFMYLHPLTQNYQIWNGNTYGVGQEVSHAIAFAQIRRAVCQRELSFLLVEKKRLGLDVLLEVFFSSL